MSISNMVAVPSGPHGSPTFGGTVSSTAEVGTPAEVSTKPYSANFHSFTEPPGQSSSSQEELVNKLRERILSRSKTDPFRLQNLLPNMTGGRGRGRPVGHSRFSQATPSLFSASRDLMGEYEDAYEEKTPSGEEYWGSLYGDLTLLPPAGGEMKLQARRVNEEKTPSQAPATGQSVAKGPNGTTHKHTHTGSAMVDQEVASATLQFYKEELERERQRKKAMQEQLDNMMAMMLQMQEEKAKEKKQAEEANKAQQEEELKHQKEIKEVERDRKSACDQVRITALVKAYIAKYGLVKNQNDYERKLLPYMNEFFDNENTPKILWDLSAPVWD